MRLQVKGAKELAKALKELPAAIAKKAIRQSQRAAMRPMLAAQKAAAPRLTGAFSLGLKLKSIKRSRNRIGVNVTVSREALNLPSGRFFYPAALEYGWKPRGSNQKVTAKGELRRAFTSLANTTLESSRQKLWEKIEEIVRTNGVRTK